MKLQLALLLEHSKAGASEPQRLNSARAVCEMPRARADSFCEPVGKSSALQPAS